MSIKPKPGEVWFADLGLVAKNRPVLVLAYPEPEDARALVVVAPLTSQIRGARGEVEIGKPRWLPKKSAVNIQGLAGVDRQCLVRKMGTLESNHLLEIKTALRELLDL